MSWRKSPLLQNFQCLPCEVIRVATATAGLIDSKRIGELSVSYWEKLIVFDQIFWFWRNLLSLVGEWWAIKRRLLEWRCLFQSRCRSNRTEVRITCRWQSRDLELIFGTEVFCLRYTICCIWYISFATITKLQNLRWNSGLIIIYIYIYIRIYIYSNGKHRLTCQVLPPNNVCIF